MAQTGFTPILLYASSTPSAVPTAGNLTNSASGAELAINYADGRLFYKDNGGVVQTIGVRMPSGVLPVGNGGTGASSLTANNVLLGNGTSAVQTVAPGALGNILTSNGTTWTSAAPASVTAVTTFSGGTTGLTPSTPTSGAVSLAGTLAVANGGTGQTTYTDGQLLIGNSTGNTLTKATLTAGTGITVTNAGGSITIAASSTGGAQDYIVQSYGIV